VHFLVNLLCTQTLRIYFVLPFLDLDARLSFSCILLLSAQTVGVALPDMGSFCCLLRDIKLSFVFF